MIFCTLYNVHISGGWEWSEEKKTDFANNIEDPDMLIAVRNTTNRESASSPDEWKPENQVYWCGICISNLIRIKYEWESKCNKG